MSLERRCRALAHAYPAGPRADEVLATLLESNDGRRWPRPGDALNVLWHGARARFGDGAPGTRFGRWGDAASVALVLAVVVQAATAGMLLATSRLPARPRPYQDMYVDWRTGRPMLRITLAPRETALLAVAVLVSLALAAAACLGRARLARALAVVAALAGAGLYALENALEGYGAYTSAEGRVVIAAGVAAAVALTGTTAVARAARAVPRWWWAVAFATALGTAGTALDAGPSLFGRGRAALVLTAYLAAAAGVALVALPLARTSPLAVGGAALLALPCVPLAVLAAQGWAHGGRPAAAETVLVTAGIWVALGLVARLAVRPAR